MASLGGYQTHGVELVVETVNDHTYRIAIEDWCQDVEEVKVKAETFVSEEEMYTIFFAVKSCSTLILNDRRILVDKNKLTGGMLIQIGQSAPIYLYSHYSQNQIVKFFADNLWDDELIARFVGKEDE